MQGTLSVVLLVGAVLFVRSLTNVRDLRLGYDVDPLLLVRWDERGMPMDLADRVAVRQRLTQAALARADVERAASTTGAPFFAGTSVLNLAVPGVDSVARLGRFTFQIVSADYFATMDTRLLRGRYFDDRDRVGAPPVAIVSDAMARRIWPNQEPLGRCLRVSWRGNPDTMPCTTIVGVVENAVHDPVADLPLRYYLPEAQLDFGTPWLLLRMRREPGAAAEDVRRTLQAVMPGQSLVTVRPARELFDAKRRSWLVGATLFVGFGVLALLVAAVGLYGVIAYEVAQRMHEMGVRMALGARATDVVRLVAGQGMRLAVAGLGVGTTIALAASRWIQPLLFQQSATDPAAFAVVGAVLIGAALVASAVPAARAVRADPSTVLRAE
jgi:putative ABC transport system permease protein